MVKIGKRILIVGCPGSGKSTLARALGEKTGLPVTHLDLLFWRADKTTVSREEFCARLEPILEEDAWIIDGNYSFTMEKRLQRADTVIFLDYPTETCLDGVKKRRHQPRPDMPWIETEEDAEFTAFIREFAEKRRPRILELSEKYADKQWIILHGYVEADGLLESI